LPLVGTEAECQLPAVPCLVAHIAAQSNGGAGQWLSVDREAGDFGSCEGGIEATVVAEQPAGRQGTAECPVPDLLVKAAADIDEAGREGVGPCG